MSQSERGSADIKTVATMLLLIILAFVFFWQLGFLPHTGPDKVIWWQGFIQGFFAIPNLIYLQFNGDKTLDIYQSGAGVYYTVCWIVGIAIPVVVGCAALFGRRH